jgi:RND family efflux transporter MFP subunit
MLSFIKRRKIALIIVFVVVVALFIGFNAGGNGDKETSVVSRGELVRNVELAGKVVPVKEADLSFEVGGTVARVYKEVGESVVAGETVVSLDIAATQADLMKAEADLAAARAELAKLQGGNNPIALITNSKTDVIQAIVDAYTQADDAVYNKVDQVFDDPRSLAPEILFAFDDVVLRDRINNARFLTGDMLIKWKASVSKLTPATYTDMDLRAAKENLRMVTSFLNDVSAAVNDFETNSFLTQTMIDGYKSSVSTARQNINTVSAGIIQAEQGFLADLSDAPVQAARVLAAEATVANYEARIAKMVIKSPISGIVSKQDAKVGEVLSANSQVVSVISADRKIEAYVPEVSVAGISLGAPAIVTLDAYGDDVRFDAKISRIDPRETVRDGVSTYKVELVFNTPDERARSGMTTNISIESMRKSDVLMIPERAVLRDGDVRKVLVKGSDEQVKEIEIKTGVSDTEGNIEIISGLEEGDIVLINPVK